MTEYQFDSEIKYMTAISVAKEMLAAGVISGDDYLKIEMFFTQKFKPVFAGIC